MPQTSDKHSFPMARAYPKAMNPVAEFDIGGRMLSLYAVEGRLPGENYSLYWNDETNPVQHNMSDWEVFKALESLLETEAEERRDRALDWQVEHA